jgi:hypothetical protein
MSAEVRYYSTLFFLSKAKVWGVLRWLMFSTDRCLTLRGLADAVTFDFSNPVYYTYDPGLRDDNIKAILEWLEGLIVVVDSRGHQYLALAHASVQDYILSTKKFDFDLSPGISHTFIARSCMGYLFHFADHPLVSDTFPTYPLALYALNNWYYHLLRCHDRSSLFPDVIRLVDNGSKQYAALITSVNPIGGLANQNGTPKHHRLCKCVRKKDIQISSVFCSRPVLMSMNQVENTGALYGCIK